MRFIESICFNNGAYQQLELHQDRVNQTCFHFFGESLHTLSELLPPIEGNRKHKVRFVYDNEGYTCDSLPYVKLPIRTMQVVKTDWFDYSFKYENRSQLNELLNTAECDEIIIAIDDLVTDCSYANLVFWDGKKWLTPERPLLEGVKRKLFIEQGLIQPTPIAIKDISSFEKLSLINAMLDIGDIEIPINGIKMS